MFSSMISKPLIEWLWVLLSIIVVFAGIGFAFSADSGGVVILALLGTVALLGLIRIICEGMIVIFTINENLQRTTLALERMEALQQTPAIASPTLPAASATPVVPKTVPHRVPSFAKNAPTAAPRSGLETAQATINAELDQSKSGQSPATGK